MPRAKLERRQFPRVSHTYTISFKRYKDAEDNWDISNTRNLSLGGALFLSSEFFPLDNILDIRLNVPGQAGYRQCQGRVQRCEGPFERAYYKTAISFTLMEENYSEPLRKSIDFFLAKDKKA